MLSIVSFFVGVVVVGLLLSTIFRDSPLGNAGYVASYLATGAILVTVCLGVLCLIGGAL